jgi:hypothetical protein
MPHLKKKVNFKPGGMYSNHWALKCQIETSTFKQSDLLGFYSASLEDGATSLRNFRNYLPSDGASYPGRLESVLHVSGDHSSDINI